MSDPVEYVDATAFDVNVCDTPCRVIKLLPVDTADWTIATIPVLPAETRAAGVVTDRRLVGVAAY